MMAAFQGSVTLRVVGHGVGVLDLQDCCHPLEQLVFDLLSIVRMYSQDITSVTYDVVQKGSSHDRGRLPSYRDGKQVS